MSRPFTVIEAEQRSEQWFAARCGLLTGSAAADVFAVVKTKGAEAAARRDLRVRLVTERLTGRTQDNNGYVNRDIQRGLDLEPEALGAYEAASGTLVTPVGFLRHNELPVGCSPDGVIGDYEGILEVKAPRAANHLRYLRAPGKVPTEHVAQVNHALFVSGARYVDFVSYCNEFPEPLQLFVTRVGRETVDLAAYELVVRQFLGEVDAEYDAVLTQFLAAEK
jgi:putative phage-type endonuclease